MSDTLIHSGAVQSSEELPKDRWRLGILIFYLQGVGALFPWNAFITPTDYYALRLAGSPFASSFESIFSISFTATGLATMLMLQSLPEPKSLRAPILGSLLVMIGAFVITTALTLHPLLLPADQMEHSLSSGANVQFAWLVICVAVSGIAVAVLLGSLNRYASALGSSYIRAVSGGQGIAGLTVSLANMIRSIPETARRCSAAAPASAPAAAPGDAALRLLEEQSGAAQDGATVEGAVLYFGGASLVLLLCLASFLILERLPFVVAYHRHAALAAQPSERPEPPLRSHGEVAEVISRPVNAAAAATVRKSRSVRARLWPWATAMTLTYSVTIALFPALTVMISASPQGTCEWRKLFTPLMFVLFNLGDTVGRNLSWQLKPARSVLAVALLRVLFAPLFILCYMQAGHLPSYADALPLALMLVFSLSNGWITTTIFVRASEVVATAERGQAAGFIVLSLNLGLAVGSGLSFVVHSLACGGCNPFVRSE